MASSLRFVRRWVVFGRVLHQIRYKIFGLALLFLLLLLLFSLTGSLLFSGSVEGFQTVRESVQTLLCLLRNRLIPGPLCKQHPVLGPIFCLSAFGVGFWLLGRLCGAVLLRTYRDVRAEMYRPSVEPHDYEMVEFLIKRLKLWMGLRKVKEFRHRVKFEGIEPPPSRSPQCSAFSTSPSSVSPSEPRLVSSSLSGTSEASILPDSPELQQYLDRLLPSVDLLLESFDRVNQLTDQVLNIELKLQNVQTKIAQKRMTQQESQVQTCLKSALAPKAPQPVQTSPCPGSLPLQPSHEDIPEVSSRRRATHSESSLLGPSIHLIARSIRQLSQTGADPEIRSYPRRRAWHSGSCHSAQTVQRCSKPHSPATIPVRPHSNERDWGKTSEGRPIKKRAWHLETSENEND